MTWCWWPASSGHCSAGQLQLYPELDSARAGECKPIPHSGCYNPVFILLVRTSECREQFSRRVLLVNPGLI